MPGLYDNWPAVDPNSAAIHALPAGLSDTEIAALLDMQGWQQPGSIFPAPANDTAALLPDQAISLPVQYPQQAAQPTAAAQHGNGILALIRGLAQPNNVNGVPHPSDLDTLLGLGVGLATGGGLQGAAGLNTLQQIHAISDVGVAQSLQHNQLVNDQLSPAGQMRKTQQQFYASRMANDVNRYIKLISDDVNHTIPDDERDRLWGQISGKYAPLGLDPGPSPSQVQQWNAESNTPEFRNAKLVETFRADYGDTSADVVKAMLQSGSSPEKVAEFQFKLEQIKSKNMGVAAQLHKHEMDATEKQIETYRKRDLEHYYNAGLSGGALKSHFAGKPTPTPEYQQGINAVNMFYDRQIQEARSGNLSQPETFFNNVSLPENAKGFPAFLNAMQLKAFGGGTAKGNSPASGSDVLMYPINTNPSELSGLSTAEKARALDLDAHPELGGMAIKTANGERKSILIKYKGKLRLLNPQGTALLERTDGTIYR